MWRVPLRHAPRQRHAGSPHPAQNLRPCISQRVPSIVLGQLAQRVPALQGTLLGAVQPVVAIGGPRGTVSITLHQIELYMYHFTNVAKRNTCVHCGLAAPRGQCACARSGAGPVTNSIIGVIGVIWSSNCTHTCTHMSSGDSSRRNVPSHSAAATAAAGYASGPPFGCGPGYLGVSGKMRPSSWSRTCSAISSGIEFGLDEAFQGRKRRGQGFTDTYRLRYRIKMVSGASMSRLPFWCSDVTLLR